MTDIVFEMRGILGGMEMMTKTMIISTVMTLLWTLSFPIMLFILKKRVNSVKKFSANNRNGAMLHLYGKQVKVDGSSLVNVPFTTGKDLEIIVTVTPGQHTIEGIFESTETVGTKTRSIRTEKLSFNLTVEARHSYSVALYFHSAEERANYYNGQTGKAILEMPLTISAGSDYIKAYIIVYREEKSL